MALPIAHGTVGWVLHRLDGRRTRFTGWGHALVFMAIANLPDIDFIFGFLLGRPGEFHRGITHSVLAVVVFGALAGFACRRFFGDRWLSAALMFGAVYASHLVVDALTINQRHPDGGQFLWPLSNGLWKFPFALFGEILIDGESRAGFLRSVLAPRTAVVLTHEALFAIAAVVIVTVVAPWLRGARERGLPVSFTPERDEEVA